MRCSRWRPRRRSAHAARAPTPRERCGWRSSCARGSRWWCQGGWAEGRRHQHQLRLSEWYPRGAEVEGGANKRWALFPTLAQGRGCDPPRHGRPARRPPAHQDWRQARARGAAAARRRAGGRLDVLKCARCALKRTLQGGTRRPDVQRAFVCAIDGARLHDRATP